MQIKLLLVVAMTAAIALGFFIPEGQLDGVYRHSVENGTHTHVKIAESYFGPITKKRGGPFRHLEPEGVVVVCGHAKGLDATDTDAANADLDRQCGFGLEIRGSHNLYSIRGNTAAFVCNFGFFWEKQQCLASKREHSGRVIREGCGAYNSGWILLYGGWLSYGYDSVLIEFCGTGP